MNYIIFTQDLPGERNWLEKQLPDCRNLETIFSGKWPSLLPTEFIENLIWEIPADYKQDVSSCPGQKIKSLFDLDAFPPDDRWTDSDHLLVDQSAFATSPRSKNAIVFHLPRSGTTFLQSILKKKCGYELMVDRGGPIKINFPLRDMDLQPVHHVPHHPDFVLDGQENFGKIDYNIMSTQSPDVFFVYRKNWWEWITSNAIAEYAGPFHYNTVPDLSKVPHLEITENYIMRLIDTVKYSFNNLCEMRVKFRKLNFYIFEFDDLIKNQELTEHTGIKYNKKSLFSNHDEMKALFKKKYADTFDSYSKRCVAHLVKIKCQILTNFDNFIVDNKN